jgi:hypothetical protein
MEVAIIGPFADTHNVTHLSRMHRWKKLVLWGLSALIIVIGSASLYRANRAAILSTACKAGLPNLSRPVQIPVHAINCTIVGQREAVSGTLFSSDHGSSLFIGERSQPMTLWIGELLPPLAQQVKQSWDQYCIQGATVTLSGWRTTSVGSFGEMGYANEQFFVDAVEAVGPLPKEIIAHLGNDQNWCHES